MRCTISLKKVILNSEISKIQRLLNNAYSESGLLQEHETKSDAAEFGVSAKKARTGLISNIVILYEKLSEEEVGGHEKELPQQKYVLDAPARKFLEAYVDYLNCVFHEYVTPEKTAKKDKKSQEDIIDNPHVYLREILIRFVTATLSIDKNHSKSGKEAKKIIDCLELFLEKINKTEIMHDKTFLFFSDISSINIAFASEHKEWIYLLKQMQDVIETMHKHTDSVARLIENLNKIKATIALYLISFISIRDISQEKLLPEWIKYALLDCEIMCLKQSKENSSDIIPLNLATKNYNSLALNQHHQQVIQCERNKNNEKIKQLYELLIKANVLLTVLDQVDILFSTTGWVLIIANVLNLNNLSSLVEDFGKKALSILQLDFNKDIEKDKKEIKKSLIAHGALSKVDFIQNLMIAGKGIRELQSGFIKSCIAQIISTAIGNLKSLEQQYLDCNLINSNELNFLIDEEEKENASNIVLAQSPSPLSSIQSSLPSNTNLIYPLLTSAAVGSSSMVADKDINLKQVANKSKADNKSENIAFKYIYRDSPMNSAPKNSKRKIISSNQSAQYTDQQIDAVLSLFNKVTQHS